MHLLILDKIFDEKASTKSIFEDIVEPKFENLKKGSNVLICTYGYSGTGKTYTILGEKKLPGLVQLTADHFEQSSDSVQMKYVIVLIIILSL